MTWIYLSKARFDGTCYECGMRIWKNKPLYWRKEPYGIQHPQCYLKNSESNLIKKMSLNPIRKSLKKTLLLIDSMKITEKEVISRVRIEELDKFPITK
jgi:hypothetical protein